MLCYNAIFGEIHAWKNVIWRELTRLFKMITPGKNIHFLHWLFQMNIVAFRKALLWVKQFQLLKTRGRGQYLGETHLKSSVGEKRPAATVRDGSDHV